MIENNRYYWSHLKTKNVTVSVKPKRKEKGLVFRVSNMVDLGNGRQTVMLDHVDYPKSYAIRPDMSDIAVPFRMGNLDFIYASGKKPSLRNVKCLITTLYKEQSVEAIVMDVLAPGDLLVFKQEEGSTKIKMVETLRVVCDDSYQKSDVNHAL
ncbi:MAG: hypothetical protein ACRBDL_05465 [Alphaproteobacteria bacterium]